jgi:hypothetical protein
LRRFDKLSSKQSFINKLELEEQSGIDNRNGFILQPLMLDKVNTIFIQELLEIKN